MRVKTRLLFLHHINLLVEARLAVVFLLFLLIVLNSVLLVSASENGSFDENGIIVWRGSCYRDFFILPIYVYNGEISNTLIVDKPISFNYTKTIELKNGSLRLLEVSLKLVPSSVETPIVDSFTSSTINTNSLKKIVVGATVKVPRNSLSISFEQGLVGREVLFYVKKLNSTAFSITIELRGVTIDTIRVAGVEKHDGFPLALSKMLGRPMNDTIAVKFIYNVASKRLYLVDKGGALVEVGEKLPLFVYPEAFDPRSVVEEVYENILEWIRGVAENPAPLKLVAERVAKVKTPEERAKVLKTFADKIYEESIAPSFIYLGRKYILSTIGSLGYTTWRLEESNSTLKIVRPAGLLEVNLKRLEELVSEGYDIRDAISHSLRIIEEERVVEEIQGAIVDVNGFNVSHIGGLLLPLPRDNPFRANMLLIESTGKIFKCDLREALKEFYGGSLDIEKYEIVSLGGNCYALKNKKTGEEELNICLGDFNGTDYLALEGDNSIKQLQREAFASWKSVGRLVESYLLDTYNALYEIILDAVKNGGVINREKALSIIGKVKEKNQVLFSNEWRKLVESTTPPKSSSLLSSTKSGPSTSASDLEWLYSPRIALLVLAVFSMALGVVLVYIVRGRRK